MTLTLYQWTVDNYHQAIDAGVFDQQLVELLKGNLIVMPPEREPHAYYNSEAGDYLRRLLGDRAKVRESHPVTLANDSEPIPDLAIVEPLGSVYLEHHPYPGNIYWLIEFSDATLEKDLNEKKVTYAESGILEYWVVNLRAKHLHIFRNLQQGQYVSETVVTTGEVTPLAFQDVKIQVQRLMHL